jgi:phytoene dehydrogenase-like protein
MLFGSVTTYRGPATPGSAAALAFGMAVPDENAKLMAKLRGASERAARRGPRALLPRRSSRQLSANALRPRRHADLRAPYDMLKDPGTQSAIGLFSTPEELQKQWEDCRRGIVPADPAIAMQFPSVHDPDLAPDGKQAVSAFSLWFPVEANEANHGEMRAEVGRRVIEKISRLAPDFDKLFPPLHLHAAPHGNHVRRPRRGLLPRSDPPRPDGSQPAGADGIRRPAPADRGLHLGSAGCHGGPGITFIPGYNAAKRALADSIGHRFCV